MFPFLLARTNSVGACANACRQVESNAERLRRRRGERGTKREGSSGAMRKTQQGVPCRAGEKEITSGDLRSVCRL